MNSADIRFYLYVFMRRLPLFVIVAGSITGISVFVAKVLPPVYRASSTILVESAQIPTELARSTGSGDTLARFQKLQQELQTRESLLALANRHGIYPAEARPSPSAIADDMRSRISLEPVFFGGNQEALGFSVSFEAEDPVLAAEVANDLSATILARDVASRSSRANDTLKFFEGDVNKLA
ncbi:MAG: lipopolysaccharide biosynthesis protein, partial [Devosia sp.]|nr:lipopolysaccharide biosynthesis protein [Devosia sp.]